jgi:RNase P/RNase MRP subunit p29
MQTPNQIPYNEFLGKFVKINKATNTRNSNRSGIAVNETKNMIFLMNHKSRKVMKFSKAEIRDYEIYHMGGTCILNGKRLLGRPEELVNKVM